jgi:hypothetical protein
VPQKSPATSGSLAAPIVEPLTMPGKITSAVAH